MTQPSTDKVLFEPTEKQDEFIRAVLSGEYDQLMYGGAIRGGKSYVAIALLFLFCRMWPGSRWALVRKDGPTLYTNTLPTFRKLIPEGFVVDMPGGRRPSQAICSNGSIIEFFPASTTGDPDHNRWRGLEVNGFILEEANEILYDTFFKAVERAGTWTVPGLAKDEQPPPLIILTCNPAKNWVKENFYDAWKNGNLPENRFYLPADARDNPYIPDATRKAWEVAKLENPTWYETFVLGNWETADEPDQLIQWSWVNEALNRTQGKATGEHYLGVDVARFGDDETVIAHRVGSRLVSVESWAGIDLVRTADFVHKKIIEHNINPVNVRIDTIGVGAGVADILRNRGLRVSSFIAGAKPTGPGKHITFRNLRAEAWWHLKELFRAGLIELDPEFRRHTKLIADITGPKYKISAERTLTIESKDEIKKRVGRSTDYGDAIMQAFMTHVGTNWLKRLNTM